MIQANELRIGNWVSYKDCWQYYQIDLYDLKYLEESIEPIPLTPEILEKAGFRINNDSGNWNSPGHTIYSNKAGSSIGILGDFIGWRFETEDDFYSWYHELKYLHQLQNLFFALTGTELEIDFK